MTGKKVWPREGITIGGRTFHRINELADYYWSKEFEDTYTYGGDDLGATVSGEGTCFKVWAPAASGVVVKLYATGSDMEDGSASLGGHTMEPDADHPGVWVWKTDENLSGTYYLFGVCFGNEWVETADPYARAAGVNGIRSMVVDLKTTDPEGWEKDPYTYLGAQTEAIVWETHVKDFSHCEDSGMPHKGKYGAVGCTGSTINGSILSMLLERHATSPLPVHDSTGVDHLKDLGITHVHFLPLAENATVDETRKEGFNWGYDPLNYNVPEGSFSEDPYHGEVRIKELKSMVLRLHEQGIGVVLDVVYNHTYHTANSWFELMCPYYYHRTVEDGGFGNASGCGNETASERSMMRKYILDSIRFWAEEYHLDGFRFDLMGIHDVETMNQVRTLLNELSEKHNGKNYLLYGEPWAALPPCMPEGNIPANMGHLDDLLPDIGVFNDEIRDGIKGSCFKKEECGFGNKGDGKEEAVLEGIIARCHKDDDHLPSRMVSYVSSHDNFTLWDKLTFTVMNDNSGFHAPEMIRVAANKMCAALYLTSQGMVFMQAGEEFGRSKFGEGNSYKAGPEINDIYWIRKRKFSELYEYYRGLIAIRKQYSCFTDPTGKAAREIQVLKKEGRQIGYLIPGQKAGEPKQIMLMFNSSDGSMDLLLPETVGEGTLGEMTLTDHTGWKVMANERYASHEPLAHFEGRKISVCIRSVLIAVSDEIIDGNPAK